MSKVHFERIKCHNRQNLLHISLRTHSTPILSLKSILGPTKNKPPPNKRKFQIPKTVDPHSDWPKFVKCYKNCLEWTFL